MVQLWFLKELEGFRLNSSFYTRGEKRNGKIVGKDYPLLLPLLHSGKKNLWSGSEEEEKAVKFNTNQFK